MLENLLHQLQYNPASPLLFNQGLFLFLFLCFIVVYHALEYKQTARLVFVTLFSYYFYYKSSGTYFWLLALVTISDYLIARAIHASKRHILRKSFVTLSLFIDLGLLCYFKYTNFFAGMLAQIVGSHFQPLDIFLPIGISFFAFQSLSYTIDVYRGRIKPLSSLLDYAFYVSFFPQLVAGPIVRATDFIPQIRRPISITSAMFGKGVFLIMAGLLKRPSSAITSASTSSTASSTIPNYTVASRTYWAHTDTPCKSIATSVVTATWPSGWRYCWVFISLPISMPHFLATVSPTFGADGTYRYPHGLETTYTYP